MLGKVEERPNRPRDGRHCDLCGCSQPAVRCDKCGCQIFCLSCDDMYHRHPKRRFHLRKAVDPIPSVPQARPVLPMKVSQLASTPGDPSKMPLPPPRKKKPGKSFFGTFRRASPDTSPQLPKKEYSWTDRLGSIKKFMSNRPLPPLPNSNEEDNHPETNGQPPTKNDLSFIHKRVDERPPQLPERSPKIPDASDQENQHRGMPGQVFPEMRNGSMEPNTFNGNRGFSAGEENQWNNNLDQNQNPHHQFGTLSRHGQHGAFPQGSPGYPMNHSGGMQQSASATDLHKIPGVDGMPVPGMPHPHYPHYPVNPHLPPHYPYPMYPQYPNFPPFFGNSFANLSNPPTTDGDFSDNSEASSRHHSSKKYPFRKRAKRSQSVMVDRMAYPGQFFPFGPFPPGYGPGPWGTSVPMEAPPSPASSLRSLNRTGRTRRKKRITSEEDDEFSVSSSPLSRPKSSSSERPPRNEDKAPLATQTTSSEEESGREQQVEKERNEKIQSQEPDMKSFSPVVGSPRMEIKRTQKQKKSETLKRSDFEPQEMNSKYERRSSRESNTDQNEQVPPSPIPVPTVDWQCRHCTFINAAGNRICQVCCKTATPPGGTSATTSRPNSAIAESRKQSVSSERSRSSPEKRMTEDDEDLSSRRDKRDMEMLNSALDEAEKEISKGLEELMKLKEDISADSSTPEKSKKLHDKKQTHNETAAETSKPVYKSTGKMRTSILEKLNIASTTKQAPKVTTSASTETQTLQNDGDSSWTTDRIIEARRPSTSSTTSDAYNSPMAQSPDVTKMRPEDMNSFSNRKDSSCQTQQDTLMSYLQRKKAEEEAFLGRPSFGYGDRMDAMASPLPPMYDRYYDGGFGMMQRSHSRASLFAGRLNDPGLMEYGNPGFGYGPSPMYRSLSRGSLTGDFPENRMSEFHNLRKPNFYLSMEELVERRRQESMRAQGLELVRMIREAEQQGFTADDIQVALTNCGKQNPLDWLQDNWRNMVDSVVTLSTNYGNDKKENDIGVLSENEARDALRLHKGNIWAAVTECVESRQRKFLELSARGKFSRKDIVDALTSSEGDVEMAYAKVTKSTGKPFLMRIWGSGEGLQNQDGAMPISEDFKTTNSYRKDQMDMEDDQSDDLWEEEGVDWDEDADEYDEEREDLEDLQTCREDWNPQNLKTPESDKSDYCDVFGAGDDNRSLSDDIFFVIPESKSNKKKGPGLLGKLAALRKDSKEKVEPLLPTSEREISSSDESKKKDADQISVSSSDNSKSGGALNILKNTISAIKDSVTGSGKVEKKLPCAAPERRTIIVRGQIAHESLDSDNEKEAVKLKAIKPLNDETNSQLEKTNPNADSNYVKNEHTTIQQDDETFKEDNAQTAKSSQKISSKAKEEKVVFLAKDKTVSDDLKSTGIISKQFTPSKSKLHHKTTKAIFNEVKLTENQASDFEDPKKIASSENIRKSKNEAQEDKQSASKIETSNQKKAEEIMHANPNLSSKIDSEVFTSKELVKNSKKIIDQTNQSDFEKNTSKSTKDAPLSSPVNEKQLELKNKDDKVNLQETRNDEKLHKPVFAQSRIIQKAVEAKHFVSNEESFKEKILQNDTDGALGNTKENKIEQGKKERFLENNSPFTTALAVKEDKNNLEYEHFDNNSEPSSSFQKGDISNKKLSEPINISPHSESKFKEPKITKDSEFVSVSEQHSIINQNLEQNALQKSEIVLKSTNSENPLILNNEKGIAAVESNSIKQKKTETNYDMVMENVKETNRPSNQLIYPKLNKIDLKSTPDDERIKDINIHGTANNDSHPKGVSAAVIPEGKAVSHSTTEANEHVDIKHVAEGQKAEIQILAQDVTRSERVIKEPDNSESVSRLKTAETNDNLIGKVAESSVVLSQDKSVSKDLNAESKDVVGSNIQTNANTDGENHEGFSAMRTANKDSSSNSLKARLEKSVNDVEITSPTSENHKYVKSSQGTDSIQNLAEVGPAITDGPLTQISLENDAKNTDIKNLDSVKNSEKLSSSAPDNSKPDVNNAGSFADVRGVNSSIKENDAIVPLTTKSTDKLLISENIEVSSELSAQPEHSQMSNEITSSLKENNNVPQVAQNTYASQEAAHNIAPDSSTSLPVESNEAAIEPKVENIVSKKPNKIPSTSKETDDKTKPTDDQSNQLDLSGLINSNGSGAEVDKNDIKENAVISTDSNETQSVTKPSKEDNDGAKSLPLNVENDVPSVVKSEKVDLIAKTSDEAPKPNSSVEEKQNNDHAISPIFESNETESQNLPSMELSNVPSSSKTGTVSFESTTGATSSESVPKTLQSLLENQSSIPAESLKDGFKIFSETPTTSNVFQAEGSDVSPENNEKLSGAEIISNVPNDQLSSPTYINEDSNSDPNVSNDQAPPSELPIEEEEEEEDEEGDILDSPDFQTRTRSTRGSEENRRGSITRSIELLRSRFEGIPDSAPIRPASPFRRMSFNSRKEAIFLEKLRENTLERKSVHPKPSGEPIKPVYSKRSIKQQLEMERKVRKMVSDRKCRTYKKAEIVVQLIEMNFEEDEALQAADECSTLEQALSYLQQECLLCAGFFPVSQIISMIHCPHKACRDCIRAYFTVQIRDRTIMELLCPFCNEPDIRDDDIAQDYFNHLDIMLKKLVEPEIHELFQRKLRDRVLMRDPNFRWCSQCSSGFIAMPNLKRLICPDCNAVTCASCRRPWEREHQGISCEAFAAWKDATDPEAQAAGLAKLLTEDGIDCPSCHFRYQLAKGGCMHFRCIQCQHDFCSGCSRPFKMGQKCGVSEFCAKLGLHAHHPRNCLFYLRDKEPTDLQRLLDMNDVKYNKEPPEGMEIKSTCQVMEQKETADGMVDDYCGKEVEEGFAGLCRVHYVEYLGQLVNKHRVDPIQIFDNDDLELVLRRANIRLPPKKYRESEEQYREKLVGVIQEELPLDKTEGS